MAGLTLDSATALSLDGVLKKGARGAIVQLWASWCRPCLEELSQLSRGRERLELAGVAVLLVNVLEDQAVVERFVRELRLEPFYNIRDAQGVIVEKLGLATEGERAMTLPVSVLVDGEGTVKAIFTEGGAHYVDRILARM